jgi:hypothetical protein
VADNITIPVTAEQIYQAWHGTTEEWAGCADKDAIERVLALLAPTPCDMRHQPPMDFAWCETHDTTFPLGERCKFDGRHAWEVYADEADEQRQRAVLAEVKAEEALSLDDLTDDVWEWHLRELGEGTLIGKVAKVAEEAGELLGHTIKSTEPRQDAAEHREKAHLEVADVIISALGAARALGIESVEDVVRRKWWTVSQRRFRTAEAPMEPCS